MHSVPNFVALDASALDAVAVCTHDWWFSCCSFYNQAMGKKAREAWQGLCSRAGVPQCPAPFLLQQPPLVEGILCSATQHQYMLDIVRPAHSCQMH